MPSSHRTMFPKAWMAALWDSPIDRETAMNDLEIQTVMRQLDETHKQNAFHAFCVAREAVASWMWKLGVQELANQLAGTVTKFRLCKCGDMVPVPDETAYAHLMELTKQVRKSCEYGFDGMAMDVACKEAEEFLREYGDRREADAAKP